MAKDSEKPVDKNPQVDRDYVALFLRSPLGPKVLGKMIDECELLNIAKDEEQQIEQNHMKIILSRCGIGFGMKGQQYVKGLAGAKGQKALISAEEFNGDDD